MAHKCLLALDTAMNGCGVGVQTYSGDIFETHEHMIRGQAENLMPMVQAMCLKAGVTPKDFEGIVTTIGPGTFTGLRLAMSVAKTLATSLDIPAYGLTTLEVIAHQTNPSLNFAVVLETKRKDFYLQCFDKDKTEISSPIALEIEGALAVLTECKVKDIVGDANERFRSLINTDKHDFNYHDVLMPSPKAMLELVEQQEFQSRDVSPLYLRGADVSRSKKKIRQISGT